MFLQAYKVFFGEFKNIYGRFWSTKDGRSEYYLKLDGYYFCKKQNKTIVIIRVRNKRTIDRMPINDVIT